MDHQVRSSRFQGIAAGPYDARLRVAEDDAVQRIVVGVDGSETSKAALRWAADLARAFGVELEAVRAFRYPLPCGCHKRCTRHATVRIWVSPAAVVLTHHATDFGF